MSKIQPLLKKKIRYLLFCTILVCTIATPLCAVAQTPPDSIVQIGSPSLPDFMKVYSNGDLLMKGYYDGGIYPGTPLHYPPIEGAGNRLMWMPERGSFRAGGIQEVPFYGTAYWDHANIGYYSTAAGYNVRASGNYSTAFGYWCTAANTGSFAVGESSHASGVVSIAMGFRAHTNARQGSFVFADRSSIDTVRAGLNHSATWRVSGGFRIYTSSNLSTGVTLQSGATVSNWGQFNAVISTSTGAYLSTNGIWQNASDVNRKHLFKNISGEDLLNRLRQMPIREWSYKVERDLVRHIGPTAQDFKAAFGLGTDERSIGTVDAEGVSLAAVQALDSRTLTQASELNSLKAENKILQARLEALEQSKNNPANKAVISFAVILLLAITIAGTVWKKTMVSLENRN